MKKLIDTGTTLVVIKDRYGKNNDVDMQEFPKEVLTPEGALALHLIESWGMVTASREDPNHTGRSVKRVMPVEEVVDRAFYMAKLAYQRLRADGLTRTGLDPRVIYGEPTDGPETAEG